MRDGSVQFEPDRTTAFDCLVGGGNMGALMRAFDWTRTPLGPVHTWPQSLRTAVSIMLASGFPMLVLWGDEYIQLYNDAYRPVLGATKHPAALGQPARDCWPEIWDDVLGPMFRSVMAGGEPIWREDLLFVLDRNGYLEETFFTFSYSAIRGETGRPEGVLVTCVETTARVLGERRLRALGELAAHASSTRTVEETCRMVAQTLSANPNDLPFAQLYLSSGDKAARLCATAGIGTGTPLAPAAVDLDHPAGCPWPIADVIAGARPQIVTDLESRVGALPGGPWPEPPDTAVVLPITPSGQAPAVGALVAGISPRRTLDGDYSAFLDLVAAQIATAIAAARAYEAERERAEALAQIDRAKTAFFSNVSHEFRTPLTLMLGPTEEALTSPSRALSGPDLDTVYRNQRRLLKLVNTLLDFSRIEAGRADACYERTDLGMLTSDIASAFRSAIERGGVRFDVNCLPIAEPVYVDRQMWEKIVLNLLSNAFKFTFDGAIRVQLAPAGSGRIELTVADSGVGIPAVELPRLFERFHRVEGSTRGRTQEGSGIGLALVHDLVALHGGEIRVDSRVGEGTTFTVTLPTGSGHLPADRIRTGVRETHAAGSAEAYVDEALRWLPNMDGRDESERRSAAASAAQAGTSVRILVVDDNADMRDYLTRLLSAHWAVDTASTGAEALQIAHERRPDLVLADVMMPGLDGFDLMRALRADERTSAIPVVLLSARAGDEARLEGLQHGANDYIVKPFSARELVIRINSQLVLAEHGRERQMLVAREQIARREAELQKEHLALLFTQFPSPMCILRGPDFVIELANPAVCAVWGRQYEDVIGRPLLEVLPEIRDQGFRPLLDAVIATGVPRVGREIEARLDRRGDGSLDLVYFNFAYAPMRNVHGETEGVLVVAMDVTEQVLARKQVDELRRQAETANRAKDEFLAVLGHELRNPLAPILTALQLMQLRGADVLQRERAIIERQAKHLVRLVDDLLDVSRIARRMIDLRKERIELSEIVARAIETVSPIIEQREHELVLDVPSSGLLLDADPARFGQVVTNLLTNAAKYTDRRGRISITAWRDGTDVCISVRDTGTGIEAAMLPNVFEMFTQEPQTLDRSQGGLGLGLTIVRSLTQLHGGSVAAYSAGRGRGAEFVVRMPSAAEESEARPGRDDHETRHANRPLRRILVVDDNQDLATTLAELLTAAGHQVRVVHDGPSALRETLEFTPDLALIDIGLPVMDGYELARRLRDRAELRGAKLVAITGYGQTADERRAAEAGFDLHVVKPVDLRVLQPLIECDA